MRVTDEMVEALAKWLHDEVEWPEYNYPERSWPEHEGDTGQRGDGWLKIVPPDVCEQFRDIARRLPIEAKESLKMPTDAEWYRRAAEAEGDHEVGAGFSVVNPTPEDLKRMEKLALNSLPEWARDEIIAARTTPPAGIKEALEEQYVVWSHKHSAWWRPNCAGYAQRLEDAGVYSRDDALCISHKGRDGWLLDEAPDELPIRLTDLPDWALAALRGQL